MTEAQGAQLLAAVVDQTAAIQQLYAWDSWLFTALCVIVFFCIVGALRK